MTLDAVVGLGANLGDRQGNLVRAVELLSEVGAIHAVSSLYESESVGAPGPSYLNAALRLRTEHDDAHELHRRLSEIELALGRERRERWGPRTLDLDLLWIDGLALKTPQLTIPHPRLVGRSFALVPLIEVAPEAEDPTGHQRYSDLDPGEPELTCLSGPSWCRAMRFLD